MRHSETAKSLFLEGYNCAQSVAGAFSAELNLPLSTVTRLASSFGGGMGRMREVCGAVSGMSLVAGILYGYDDPKDRDAKTAHYARIQQLAAQFREQFGSIVCRELLGAEGADHSHIPSARTDSYYKKRPCADLVATAAEILSEYITNHPF
ncbi:MAG: C-GCAxxG-C-C family protein [Oscillospiraceae bacterium]|jgi:C_GCAxxG_C_C family probable redox protein